MVISSIGRLAGVGSASWGTRAILVLAALIVVALAVIAWWATRDRAVVASALDRSLGDGWRQDAAAESGKDALATIDTARRFVRHVRDSSTKPVVFAELSHGHHSFDLFHSLRYSAVVDGIECFAAWVRSGRADGRS